MLSVGKRGSKEKYLAVSFSSDHTPCWSLAAFLISHTLLPSVALVFHIFTSHNVFLFKWEVNIDKSHLWQTLVWAGQSSTLTPRIHSPDWTSDESLLLVDLFSSHKVLVLKRTSSVLDMALPPTSWPYPLTCMQPQLGPLSCSVQANTHSKLNSEKNGFLTFDAFVLLTIKHNDTTFSEFCYCSSVGTFHPFINQLHLVCTPNFMFLNGFEHGEWGNIPVISC